MTEEQEQEPVRYRLVKSGSWLIAARVVERLVGIVNIAILARLLTPADFGIVAVAGTVVAAVELLGAFGFDWALVRHRELSADRLNSGWTLRAIFGLITLTVLTLVGPAAASFYRQPPLRLVLIVLGVASFVGSLENIGTVHFRRDFAFHKEFLIRAIAKLCGFAVTVTAAFALRSYWALVAGILTLRCSSTVTSYILHPFRPRPTLKHARELMGFSFWLLLGSLIEYCRERFSDLYLGRAFGPRATGLFSVAGEISYVPITEIAAPINRVAYSKYSEDIRTNNSISESYANIASLIWIAALPLAAGTVAVAPEAVAILLGPQWRDAANVVRLLAIGTGFTVLVANTHYVYWALGHPRAVVWLSVAGTLMVIPASIGLSQVFGYAGVALAYALTSGALVPINFWLLRRLAGISFWDLWRRAWRTTIGAAGMYLCLSVLFPEQSYAQATEAVPQLLVKCLVGAAAYVASVAGIWIACRRPPGPEQTVQDLLRGAVRGRVEKLRVSATRLVGSRKSG